MNKDDPIRQDVINDTKSSMFIAAGAGAGKTTLLVKRISKLLSEGVKASEIVVITFTNAAAEELRERISAELRSGKTENVRLDEMTISTIHSFCNSLISMRSFDEGLGLSRRLLENDENEARLSAAFDEYIKQNSGKPELQDMEEWYGFYYKDILKPLFMKMADREEADYVWDEKLCAVPIGVFRAEALRMAKAIQSALEKHKTKLGTLFIGYNKYEMNKGEGSFVDCLSGIINNKNVSESEADALDFVLHLDISSIKYPVNKGTKEEKEIRKQEMELMQAELKGIIGNFKERVEAKKAVCAIKAVLPIVAWYQNAKGKTEYANDTLLYMTKRLTEKPEAVAFFQKKYRYFFVDEYQDTDDMQTALIWNLVRDYESEPAKIGERGDSGHALRQGGLVVVGDEKQSIYRFRGADATLFGKMRERMLEAGKQGPVKAHQLSVNFRSNKAIIDWVNKTFQPLFSGLGESYEDMVVSGERDTFHGDSLEGVFSAAGNSPDGVVSLIRALVNSGVKIVKPVKNGTELRYEERPIEYSDIMILTNSTYQLPVYAGALRKVGIPVNLIGNLDDLSKVSNPEPDIQEMIHTIRGALDTFIAYVNYMNDPYSVKTQVMLIQKLAECDYFRLSGGEQDIFRKEIKKARRYLGQFSPLGVAGYFKKHPEHLMPKNCAVEDYIYGEIEKIFDGLYEQLAKDNVQSLEELARMAGEYREKKKERLSELSEDRNAVCLMNRHKAKGLQAPIVIAAERPDRKIAPGSMPGEYKEGRKYYPVAVSEYKRHKTYFRSYALDPVVMEKEKAASLLDTVRLEYVEATRAKEVLIYMVKGGTTDKKGSAGKSDDDYIQMSNIEKVNDRLFSFPEGLPDLIQMLNKKKAEGEAPEKEENKKAAKAADSADAADTSIKYEPAKDEILEEETEEICNLKKKIYLTMNPSGMEHKDSSRAVRSEVRPRGNHFGTTMHRCFELLVKRKKEIDSLSGDERKNAISALISEAILENAEEAGINKAEKEQWAEYLKKKIGAFLDGALFREICEAKEAYPEYEFSFELEGCEAEQLIQELKLGKKKKYQIFTEYDYDNGKLWVNGIADLILVRQDGSILIVDYKSDSLVYKQPDPEKKTETEELTAYTPKEFKKLLQKRYMGQLALYKAAVKKLFGVTDDQVECRLYSMYDD